MGRLLFLLGLLLSQLHAVEITTHELSIADKLGDIAVLARLPQSTSQQLPIVILSHGLGGSRHGYRYLSEGWAQAGFVVLHLQHSGSDNAVWQDLPPRQRLAALKKAAGAKQALDRMHHVTALLDQLPKWQGDDKHPLAGKLNVDRIAIAGHSFGSVTTLSMMGQNFGLVNPVREPRLKVGIALSPSPSRTVSNPQAFGQLQRPIICVTGSQDTSMIQSHLKAEGRQQVYAALPTGQAYQLVYDEGKHGDFGDERWNASRHQGHVHQSLVPITVDFLQAHLLADEAALKRLRQARPELNKQDRWQWK
jgi:predicted dienelactone hydrolase